MKAEYFSSDIREFFRLLHEYKVKYLIVGGEAVIYYGYPRLTGDVDFFYKNDQNNAEQLFQVLLDFWDGDIPGLKSYKQLQSPGYVIQFGIPPNRIDLLNSIQGIEFEEAWPEKNVEEIVVADKTIPINFIGLSHLIINKRKTGRNKDLDDLNYLENIES